MGFAPSITPAPGDREDQKREEELTPEESEAQMRRALETLSAGAPARPAAPAPQPFGRPAAKKTASFAPGTQRKHRFVQDGEVQVVHLSLQKERARDTAAPAQDARGTREQSDRAAQEAQAMVRGLQTKLAHAEIALREAVQRAHVQSESANSARNELAALRAEVRAADQARLALEQKLADQRASMQAEIDRLTRVAAEAAVRAAPPPAPQPRPRKPRVKAVAEPEVEQEPVKWWLSTKPAPPRGKRGPKPA